MRTPLARTARSTKLGGTASGATSRAFPKDAAIWRAVREEDDPRVAPESVAMSWYRGLQ